MSIRYMEMEPASDAMVARFASEYSRQQVLIVDDEQINRTIAIEAVGNLADVVQAANGREALESCQTRVSDLILVDIDMPVMNGITLCKAIKADPALAHCAVIFITSMKDKTVESEALAAGGIDFINKPIDIQQCKLKIKNHLLLRAHAKQPSLGWEDLKSLTRSLPAYISYWTPDWNNVFCNDVDGNWFGMTDKEVRGRHIDDVFPSELMALVDNFRQVSSPLEAQIEHQYQRATQGAARHIQASIKPSTDKSSKGGFLITLYDITTLKEAERSQSLEKELFRITLTAIGDAVIATDTTGLISFMNPVAERLTGWSSNDAEGQPIEVVMQLRDGTTLSAVENPIYSALAKKRIISPAAGRQLISLDNEIYRIEDSATPITAADNTLHGAIIVFHDITETVAMATKMSYLTHHDQLTNLPNRFLLQDRMEYAFGWSAQNQTKTAILLVDIDNFKFINDIHGHQCGDEILKQVAKRLEACLPSSCTIARIDGDEFAIVMPNIKDAGDVDTFINLAMSTLSVPVIAANETHDITASVGIAIYPEDGDDQSTVMRHADAAMYRAKQTGRNRHCYFSMAIEDDLNKRHAIEKLLRTRLEHNQLVVHYQPKVRFSDMKIIGAEALVRILDDDNKIVPPDMFIGIAEETGLIKELGLQVLKAGCNAARRWHDLGHIIRISVNVAPSQLEHGGGIQSAIIEVLDQSQLPPEYLQIEVTETALMENFQYAVDILEQLKSTGISIAIDDFGTGYSSLAYLKKLPVDVLKIDKSFVDEMMSSGKDLAVVKAIIGLAKNLDLNICPEGIETLEQLNTLEQLGCEYGQGYFLGRPIGLEEFISLLN